MMMTKNLLIAIVATIALGGCATTGNDEHAGHGMDMGGGGTEAFLGPIELYPEMTGDFSRSISSNNATTQAYFNQGMQLRYAYAVDAAARSFREAWKADPNCAICYWGESFSLSAYLNGSKTAEKAPYALAAAKKAYELRQHASPVERALIDAIQVWHIEDYDVATRRVEDQKFADAMAKVYEQYPDDLDVVAVYAVALFLLEERRGTRELDDPNVIRLHHVLEGALAKDIKHPGACHLYIHATESTVRPDLALPCAEHLGNVIPGASHLNHMPSHTWNEVGMWGDSVRANTQAWHSDLKAAAGKGVAIYQSHNLHMLLFAASFDGQGAVATQAGKDYRKVTNNSMYEVLTLIRFGRFDEVPGITNRPADGVAGALWDFSQGYAALRNGDMAKAKRLRTKVLNYSNTTTDRFRFHPGGQVAGTTAHILDGEIKRAEGDLAGAIAAFEEATRIEDSMGYDEPEPLPFAARHWLGAALIEAGRFADAEQAYRDELADHPHNGWSLLGLQQAIKAQGRDDPAVIADLEQSWARSDTWIQSSRF
jgi:tetratricopeptide (TPR) repeat protein